MSTSVAASGLPTFSPMYSIGARSRSPSPITIVPLMSESSMARRMASTAARSAPLRSPRPMRRAAAMAPASVAATASTPIRFSTLGLSARALRARRDAWPGEAERLPDEVGQLIDAVADVHLYRPQIKCARFAGHPLSKHGVASQEVGESPVGIG